MRIAVIGGGAGGLLFATLAARNVNSSHVDLFERNQPGEAFGFGVVFSEATQRGVDEADSALRKTLDAHGVRWDAIEIRLRGERFGFAGNGMGAVLRKELLATLQREAAAAGVAQHFGASVEPTELGEYDLIVAADGANSRSRATIGDDALGVTYSTATAKFIWFATPHPFDGLTFLHQQWSGADDANVPGVFAAHAYPIAKNLSTFIVETDEATWRAAGLDGFDLGTPPGPSDENSQRMLERLFAPLINNAQLIGNNSRWGNFRTIRSRRWYDGNIVLLGDAVHTAHFSVGSGTKMALEDAIALARALADNSDDLQQAFAAYEAERRPQVARIQDAARPSLSWWEHFGEYHRRLEPWQFAFHFFSRALPASRIARRDAGVVDDARAHWAAEHGAAVLSSPVTLVDTDGRPHEFAGRLLAADELPTLVVIDAPRQESGIDTSVAAALAGADGSVLVRGGDRLTNQLVAESVRLTHGRTVVVSEPGIEVDLAETLVLSGRADAVAR